MRPGPISWMSMIGFAGRSGTAVDPMCWMGAVRPMAWSRRRSSAKAHCQAAEAEVNGTPSNVLRLGHGMTGWFPFPVVGNTEKNVRAVSAG